MIHFWNYWNHGLKMRQSKEFYKVIKINKEVKNIYKGGLKCSILYLDDGFDILILSGKV